MVTVLRPSGTWTAGGWPTKLDPQAVPTTFHALAGTTQLAAGHAAQDTTQFPFPSAAVCTAVGASGPRAAVVKVAGVDAVDWVLM
jgi:hypothetical protein